MAFPLCAGLYPHGSTHNLHQFLANCESQTRPTMCPCIAKVYLPEWLENHLQTMFGYALARVMNAKFEKVRAAPNGQ